MKRDLYKQRPSYAFLMEMLWVCGFFVLCAGIFVLLFVKADQVSTHAEDLSHAIAIAQSNIETAFVEEPLHTQEIEYYTSDWQPTTKDDSNCYATVTTTYETNQQLLTVSVVINQVGQSDPLYELTGSHYLPSSS